jgi:hypothetical protein
MAAETKPVARQRPRTMTVFAAAFVAGAAAAVGVNRALDVHLAQAKPQVECEPIFVALRSLPQGVPVTVWDVALRDWPKAMLPDTAMRVTDSFEGCLLKYPLREGQPLLSVQLGEPMVQTPPPAATGDEPQSADSAERIMEEAFVAPAPASSETAVVAPVEAETVEIEPAEMETAGVEPVEPKITAVEVVEVVEAAEQEAAAVAPGETETAVVAPVKPERPIVTPVDIPAEEIVASEPGPSPEPREPVAPVANEPTLATLPTTPSMLNRTEPTVASPAMAPVPVAPRPSNDIGQILGSAPLGTIDDMPSPPGPDLADLPSVMADATDPAPPATDEDGEPVRYLVVPERIARQADTSFAAPLAPAAVDPTVPASQSAGQAEASQGRPPAATATAPPPARSAEQRSGKQPRPQASQRQSSPSPKAWGGMFPNVSAGLEAIGRWRNRGRDEVASERAVPQQSQRPGSTTR